MCIELYRYEVYTHKCYVYSRNGITVLPGPMLRYIDEATLLFWFLLTYSTAEKKKITTAICSYIPTETYQLQAPLCMFRSNISFKVPWSPRFFSWQNP